jgi:hypothetical protein
LASLKESRLAKEGFAKVKGIFRKRLRITKKGREELERLKREAEERKTQIVWATRPTYKTKTVTFVCGTGAITASFATAVFSDFLRNQHELPVNFRLCRTGKLNGEQYVLAVAVADYVVPLYGKSTVQEVAELVKKVSQTLGKKIEVIDIKMPEEMEVEPILSQAQSGVIFKKIMNDIEEKKQQKAT